MLIFRRANTREIIHDDYHTVSRRRKNRRIIFSLVTGFVTIVLLVGWHQGHAQVHTQSSLSEQKSVLAGQLLLKFASDGQYLPALMLHSSVHFNINGMVSHATMTQSFRNDTQEWVEALYLFPLPEKAAVNRLRITAGDRVIEGRISEREAAKAVYLDAKKSGRKASLEEQHLPNMFTTSVANIAPGETVVINIDYLQTLEYVAGEFSLRFPMTIIPRYKKPTAPIGERNKAFVPEIAPLSLELIPDYNPAELLINPISISASIDMGMPIKQISSISHDVVFSSESLLASTSYIADNNSDVHRYTVQLKSNSVSMDRDFILSWLPDIGEQPAAAVFSERVGGQDYALVMVVPPTVSQPAQLAKEVIYIIDTSGSMGGVSMMQARQGLMAALRQLSPEDRFNIIEFNSDTNALFPNAQTAHSSNIDEAITFINSLQARGGTEMAAALDAALTNPVDDAYLRQVIFITDGAVSNEDALFKLIHKKLGGSRLFTVAIGSAPNLFFMRKAAQLGRGSLTHISSVEDVSEQMISLFKKLDSPVAGNIAINWPNGVDGINGEYYPKNIPDLYRSEPLLISAKMTDVSGEITVTGIIANGDVEQQWEKKLTVDSVSDDAGISTLWAREKISSLLDEKIMGASPDNIRSEVLSVALQHQLLSPYTSFVAVEKFTSRVAEQPLSSKRVANAQVHGKVPQHFSYPATATGSMQAIIYGISFLLMAIVFFQVLRRDEQPELLSCEK